MIQIQRRNHLIDFLKGIAIIAVVLYHLGISGYGYLGVDLFFVISGYFVVLGLTKNFSQEKFSYWSFINKRLARLWPGLILISAVSLGLGYYFMLPLHYKLNCESVIGTITFTNNFIQYITSGGYWAPDNELKPLMHTWYIGILMQFYIIIPFVFVIAKLCAKQWENAAFYILTALSLLSLLLYLSPYLTEAQNFYLLPSRFFELGSGGLLAIILADDKRDSKSVRAYIFCIILVLTSIIIFSSAIDANKLRLTIIVALSVIMVCCSQFFSITSGLQRILSPITFLGVASYSLYLSHQVFFAFYRYIVNNLFAPFTNLWLLIATIAIGIIFYYILEKPFSGYIAKKKSNSYRLNLVSLFLALIITSISFNYYKQNGLVRDVPELSLYVGQNNQTPDQYNDFPHNLNSDFKNNGRQNIFVIGDSFGRDWVNILMEAGVDSMYNISYTMYVDKNTKDRLSNADYVFVATNLPFFESYNYHEIYPELFSRNFWRVGLKSFSTNFLGNIYRKRNSSGYYDTTGKENDYAKNINLFEKAYFKDNFIDMMAPITQKDGTVRLFTKDKMLITQDGIHLTKAGAKMYAEKLDVWQYFK